MTRCSAVASGRERLCRRPRRTAAISAAPARRTRLALLRSLRRLAERLLRAGLAQRMQLVEPLVRALQQLFQLRGGGCHDMTRARARGAARCRTSSIARVASSVGCAAAGLPMICTRRSNTAVRLAGSGSSADPAVLDAGALARLAFCAFSASFFARRDGDGAAAPCSRGALRPASATRARFSGLASATASSAKPSAAGDSAAGAGRPNGRLCRTTSGDSAPLASTSAFDLRRPAALPAAGFSGSAATDDFLRRAPFAPPLGSTGTLSAVLVASASPCRATCGARVGEVEEQQ